VLIGTAVYGGFVFIEGIGSFSGQFPIAFHVRIKVYQWWLYEISSFIMAAGGLCVQFYLKKKEDKENNMKREMTDDVGLD